MSNHKNIIYLFIVVLISGCSLVEKIKQRKANKEEGSTEQADSTFVTMISSTTVDSIVGSVTDSILSQILNEDEEIEPQPFYPFQETISDIQEEMIELRAKVLDYESRIKNHDNSIESLHKIQFPHLTHEIELTNGTLVHGKILHENSDRMIVKTQIGQLTIDKANVSKINNISPNYPEVEFQGDPAIDSMTVDHRRIFSGKVVNTGFRRADFVRVIFKLWSEKTELIGIDSSYIEGTNVQYDSGVISDTAIEPGNSASYNVHVKTDSTKIIRYVTKEINWDTFE
tara:strand:- start:1278 stop:2132 length:855 start_codon:yes stop_codon:yes gene_type:complete